MWPPCSSASGQVTDFLAKSTVRTTMVSLAQAPEVRPAIDDRVSRSGWDRTRWRVRQVPLPALLVQDEVGLTALNTRVGVETGQRYLRGAACRVRRFGRLARRGNQKSAADHRCQVPPKAA